jgi:hypothetical protein
MCCLTDEEMRAFYTLGWLDEDEDEDKDGDDEETDKDE